MPIDEQLLKRLQRYEDRGTGISEEFLDPNRAGAGSLRILSRPLGEQANTGWVICPSLGSEQAHLRRLEGLVARELAVQGFPTLRLRRGLNEGSAQPTRAVSLAAELEEIEGAVAWLADEGSVRRVGLLGAVFGGTVAALAAERLEPGLLGLWEPVRRG
jgi:hypothetical protein